MPEGQINRGQNIDTFITEELYRLPPEAIEVFRTELGLGGPPRARMHDTHLPLPELTLRRGSKVRLPAGEEMARHFHFKHLKPKDMAVPDDEESIAFFNDEEFRGRTPLWYYLLREAAVEGSLDPEPSDGPELPIQKLGTFGSHIVAEVILQVLAADPQSIFNQGKDWRPPSLPFPGGSEFRTITSMSEAVEFIRSWESNGSIRAEIAE